MYMIKIKSSNKNHYKFYSESLYEFSIFDRDENTKELKAFQGVIDKNHLEKINSDMNYNKKGRGRNRDYNYSDKETVIILFKNNQETASASERLLQSEDDQETNMSNSIRIYYGEDPYCDLCSNGTNGLIIAAMIISLLCFIFISIWLIFGIVHCCRKNKETFDIKKSENRKMNNDEFKDFSEESKDVETFNFSTGQDNEDYFNKANPNLALQKDTIPKTNEMEGMYNTV